MEGRAGNWYYVGMYVHYWVLYYFLCRRNWRKRYFALRGKTLFYYSDSDLSIAKPNGAIDLTDVMYALTSGGWG